MLSVRRPRRVVRGLGHAFLYLSIYLSISSRSSRHCALLSSPPPLAPPRLQPSPPPLFTTAATASRPRSTLQAVLLHAQPTDLSASCDLNAGRRGEKHVDEGAWGRRTTASSAAASRALIRFSPPPLSDIYVISLRVESVSAAHRGIRGSSRQLRGCGEEEIHRWSVPTATVLPCKM